MATNTYVALDKVTASGSVSSITFSSISSAYTDLVVVLNTGNGSNSDVRMRFNADTASNYSRTGLTGNGTSASSFRSSSATYIEIDSNGFSGTTIQQNIILNIANYSNTTTYKTALARANNASFGTDAIVGLWRNTAAITSIEFFNSNASNWIAGSTFSLYGISAIGGVTPKATGGTVTSDGTYYYHSFEMSGNFIPNQSLSCDYLVVAGGGGGGGTRGGGAGAGGYLTGSAFSVTAQSYPVTVGGGGAGASDGGTNGSNSVFSSITSTGGGGGGSIGTIINGVAGGSGGGGGGSTTSAGTGGAASPSGQGNAGGYGRWDGSNPRAGGGGGGASAAGGNAFSGATSLGGAGGAGTATSISGTSVTYAGGGGGGVGSGSSTVGAGGAGGGGTGGKDTDSGVSGTANRGAGGGGGGGTGGSGGSGIVIVRYLKV